MKRTSGVLLHVSSLWGEYGCGSFGAAAREFIDFLSDAGFGLWQVLPFGVVDEYGSPYKSHSSFGGNPFFIDLEELHKNGLINADELSSARQNSPYLCELERLESERFELLSKAASRLSVGEIEKVEAFIKGEPYLEKFARFMALRAANNNAEWCDFVTDEIDEKIYFAWCFIQYEFRRQWQAVRDYAAEKGIKIVGDLPIYVSYDSADVYFEKENFLLDKRERPTAIAGVPPDDFAEDGQVWGNPLYDWKHLKKTDYAFWTDRLAYNLSLFDGVRIDHFRAIDAYFSIPAGAETAKDGKWIKGPGKSLVNKINEVAGDAIIIAEDLGVITDSVRALVDYSGFATTRVLQFGFPASPDNVYKPHNYPKNSAAYTGTHDNNTLLGYVWEISPEARRELFDYCGYAGEDFSEGCRSIIRAMLASHADIVIIPIQDLLVYGRDTRMNTPGRADANWRYRLTREQLDTVDREKYKHLNRIFGR